MIPSRQKVGGAQRDPTTTILTLLCLADYNHLISTLEALETHARSCGLLSISGQADAQNTRNLATRNAETLQAVDTFFQEKNRLLMNIRAAVNASSAVGSLATPAAAAASATAANTTK